MSCGCNARPMQGGPCGGCGCADEGESKVCGFGVAQGVLASVYAPVQAFEGLYDTDSALRRGTMFEGLDKPFYGEGKGVNCRGEQRQR